MNIVEPYYGRYFEDFEPGQVFKHWPGRTLSEADNTWFTLVTMNQHPVHFDAHFASLQHHGKILVNSCFTLALVVGMSVRDISQNCVANLEWKEVKITAPLFIGDTVYAETEILSARASKSKPDVGLVAVQTRAYNQENTQVMTLERTIMAKTRAYNADRLPHFGAA